MSAQTVEERLTRVEAEIEALKQKKQDKEVKEPRGWKRIVGRFADSPGFEEGVRYGREWRESEDLTDDEDTS